jgi:hypothetical protein
MLKACTALMELMLMMLLPVVASEVISPAF